MQASRSAAYACLVALSTGVTVATGTDGDGTPPGTDSPPAAEAHAAWSYAGDTGPDRWGDLEGYETCGTGVEQSPIDLADATAADLAEPEFSYSPGLFTLENNGHTVQTKFEVADTMSVDGTSFNLLQIHFHTPSEHTIDGASFPAEFHLVHESSDGGLAVVGVMIADGEENPFLAASLGDYPPDEGEVAGSVELDPSELLPVERTTYRYPGSLTTPPCTEGIGWFVMTEPVTASSDQIATLEALFGVNNRPVQPLNDRVIETDASD